MHKLISSIFLLCTLMHIFSLKTRSVFRKEDTSIPTIITRWSHKPQKKYIFKNYYFEEYPTFHVFDNEHFYDHLLPDTAITYRNEPKKSIKGKSLSALIEKLVQEIEEFHQKTEFISNNFDILKDKDFNWQKGIGLIIVKFKKYPFVVKLFLEKPETFFDYHIKGVEPYFFHHLGGGCTRHLTGFTRIKNLEHIQTKLTQDKNWQEIIDTPRKWHWLPKINNNIEITGIHIGTKKQQKTTIPAIYAVVADAITAERKFSLKSSDDRRLSLALSYYLRFDVDAHAENFLVEKDTQLIVIIDTEHFPTVVGMREDPPVYGYFSWYAHLAAKMLKDTFCRSKQERRLIQKRGPSEKALA